MEKVQRLNDNTKAQFAEMLSFENASGANVDELVNSVTSSILDVLDAIAPKKI